MESENINVNAERNEAGAVAKLAVPIAIVIAGLAIAAAVFFGNKNNSAPVAPVVGNKQATEISVDPVTASDHIYGNPNAKVIIVEYSDTECPFCKSFHPTLERIMNDYSKGGNVAWVYRHFPLPFHTKSAKEAQATECVNKLGGSTKFWEYLAKIFDITPANNQLDPAELPRIAKSLGINEAAFNNCLSGGTMQTIVDKNIESGKRAGLQGTPYSIILVDKKVVDTINGGQAYETVKAQIDNALK